MKLKSLSLLIFVFATVAVFAGLANHYHWIEISAPVLAATRWIVWGLLIYLAILKKSLTPWIVVGMFLGCEIGFSFPSIAIHLDVLSSIFLRLIKTIIAPLIFSTLVVGLSLIHI